MQENKQHFSPIKARILQLIENQGISKYKFYKDTGITRGVLDKKTGISEENIAKFIAYFPTVNLNWLIKGVGEIENKPNKNLNSSEDNSQLLKILAKERDRLTKTVQEQEKTIGELMNMVNNVMDDNVEILETVKDKAEPKR